MKFFDFCRSWKVVISCVGTIIVVAICINVLSRQEIYISNNTIHLVTWRYNISTSKVGDDFLVSSFDKITKVGVIKTFSESKEKAIRTVIIKENIITVYDENGKCVYSGGIEGDNHTKMVDIENNH